MTLIYNNSFSSNSNDYGKGNDRNDMDPTLYPVEEDEDTMELGGDEEEAEEDGVFSDEPGRDDGMHREDHSHSFVNYYRYAWFSPNSLLLKALVVMVVVLSLVGARIAMSPKGEFQAIGNTDDTDSDGTLPRGGQLSHALQQEYFAVIHRFLIENKNTSDVLVTEDAMNGPSYQAMHWLAFTDTLYLTPNKRATRNRLLQRYALTVLYFANNDGGTSWTLLNTDVDSGWMKYGVGVHECDWYFVQCDHDDDDEDGHDGDKDKDEEKPLHVVGLKLARRDGRSDITMTGNLRPELGLLSRLRHLDLSQNRLEGTIPQTLYGSLSKLVELDLSFNQLHGTLSSEIGRFTDLQTLKLSNNQFTGSIPPFAMKQLTNLQTLTLNGNQELVGRMDSQVLSVLPKLRVVDLSFTKFEGSIPNQIASCKRLNELRLWKVAISGTIPTELGSCTSLKRLVVGGTDRMLGTIPSELGRLIDLYELKLSWIPFVKATIPTSLANLSKLQEFSLRSSHLIGTLPIEYGSNLSSLQTFDVSLNPSVTGTIPTEYGLLSNLKQLMLHGTNLTGTVGEEVCSIEFSLFNMNCKDPSVICDCCTECSHGNGHGEESPSNHTDHGRN